MSPIQTSLLFCSLLALTSLATALNFIDAISSASGTAPLNFSSLVFNQSFTVGWIDGSGPVNLSIWSHSSESSNTFIETFQSNLQPSGSFDWIPTTDRISKDATSSPPRNSNIIGARDDKDRTQHLRSGKKYRMTVSDNTTTVFSPVFRIAAAQAPEEEKSQKKGLSKMTILIIGLSVLGFLLLLGAAVAFAMHRKRAAAKAKRVEILIRKVNSV